MDGTLKFQVHDCDLEYFFWRVEDLTMLEPRYIVLLMYVLFLTSLGFFVNRAPANVSQNSG